MSLPDPAPARKYRRLGLWGPFAVAGLAVVAWSGVWLWAQGEAGKRMDAAVGELSQAGYQVSWKSRELSGYPFRLDVTLTDALVREPSGGALRTPRLEAEAFMHAPGHWMLAAPQGLTFVRPRGGPVVVTARTLRASLRQLDRTPPSFSFQGIGLAFTPAAGARPYFLSAAEKVEFHLRPGPDDEGGVFLKLEGGKAGPTGLFAALSAGKPIAIEWNSTTSKMSGFKGADWADAVRAWTAGGGTMAVRDAAITAGDVALTTKGGKLSVSEDGRLLGALDLNVRQAPRILAALAQTGLVSQDAANAAAAAVQAGAQGDQTRVPLVFEGGEAGLGPAILAPAPRIYQAR